MLEALSAQQMPDKQSKKPSLSRQKSSAQPVDMRSLELSKRPAKRALKTNVRLGANDAKRALKDIKQLYGPPEKRADGSLVWSVENTDRSDTEAKIITLSAQETSDGMMIAADRTPIAMRPQNGAAKARPPGSPIRSYHPNGRPAKSAVPKALVPNARAIKRSEKPKKRLLPPPGPAEQAL